MKLSNQFFSALRKKTFWNLDQSQQCEMQREICVIRLSYKCWTKFPKRFTKVSLKYEFLNIYTLFLKITLWFNSVWFCKEYRSLDIQVKSQPLNTFIANYLCCEECKNIVGVCIQSIRAFSLIIYKPWSKLLQ